MSLDEQDVSHSDEPVAEEQSPERTKPEESDNRKSSGKDGQDGEKKKDDKQDKKQEEQAKKSSPWIKVIGLVVVVLAVAGGRLLLPGQSGPGIHGRRLYRRPLADDLAEGRGLRDRVAGERQPAGQGRRRAGADRPARLPGRAGPGDGQPHHRQGAAAIGRAERGDRAQELPGPPAAGAGPIAAGARPAVPGADRLQAPAFRHPRGDDAAERRPVHRPVAAGPGPGRGRPGHGAAGGAGAAEHRHGRPAGQPDRGAAEAGAGAAWTRRS